MQNVPHARFPEWLDAVAYLSLALALLCGAAMAIDIVRRPQKMAVMSVVWPLTALFGSVLWLAAYFAWGRSPAREGSGQEDKAAAGGMPFAVFKAASHCGAGCTVGDIVAEVVAASFPALLVVLGWHRLFGERTFAVWILDYVLAFGFGIAFQYFSIQPMRHLPFGTALAQAVKADAASITAWQVGMYGFMAISQFLLIRPIFGAVAAADQPEFWFAMQIAMLCGFATSYPINWLLIRIGLKERM